MARLQMDSTGRMELLNYLEAILGCVKSLHASVGAVMADVAAIRNTVFEDAEEIALYRTNLKMAVATARPMIDEAMRSYDELLEEMVDSQQYQN
jgi:phosphoenolpyruvate-protein kinase (PTS system EI component)